MAAPLICLVRCGSLSLLLVRKHGWGVSTKHGTLMWLDQWSGEDMMKVGPKKMNHFPGMKELCNKASLARHLNRMKVRPGA